MARRRGVAPGIAGVLAVSALALGSVLAPGALPVPPTLAAAAAAGAEEQLQEQPGEGFAQLEGGPASEEEQQPAPLSDVGEVREEEFEQRQREEGTEGDPGEEGAEEGLEEDPGAEDREEQVVVRPATPPSVTTSTIPLGSILVAVAVLALSLAVLVRVGRATRSGLERPEAAPVVQPPADVPRRPAPADAPERPEVTDAPLRPTPAALPADRETLELLVLLGQALLDAGDAVNHVEEVLTEVAQVGGVENVGVLVLPTALVVSVPGAGAVQTEVTRAGSVRLRLDQTDALFRLVRRLRRAELTPVEASARILRIRQAPPLYGARVRLAGYLASTTGLALLLRGGWLDVLVAGLLAVVIGGMQLLAARLDRSYQPFLPVLGAAVAAVVVFGLGRVLPELSVFPPLVAPLVAFLPGALLTIAVYELATGQVIAGAGRLAAGMLQLLLLALGIVAGAQLVGVPAAEIAIAGTSPVSIALPWLGVAVFGVGVQLFNGADRAALPWMLLVLYVAYAGQVVGGLFLGPSLSAFVGAVAMTPVAMLAARQPSGPPTLITFLPGFWLLVPGAMGLAGVTSLLDEDRLQGLGSLVDMGTSMVGITLGILLGLAIGSHLTSLVTRWGTARAPLVER